MVESDAAVSFPPVVFGRRSYHTYKGGEAVECRIHTIPPWFLSNPDGCPCTGTQHTFHSNETVVKVGWKESNLRGFENNDVAMVCRCGDR